MKPLMDNQENVAINIKLKEGKKRFTFGQIAAGLAIQNCIGTAQNIYVQPDRSLNVLTDFNNVGTLPFTTRDYYRFTGGFRNLSTRGGTTINVGNNAVGLATLENNRAANIVSKFGA